MDLHVPAAPYSKKKRRRLKEASLTFLMAIIVHTSNQNY